MRILQINAVYKTKSTGRIVMEMHKYFQSKGIESYVAYATENTDNSKDPNVFRIGNTLDHKLHALAYRIDKMQGLHSIIATLLFLKKVRKINPDIVLLHNLHSNYIHVEMLSKGLAKQNIKVAIILHDCWFFTGGCYHYTAKHCLSWKNGCEKCKEFGIVAKEKYNLNRQIMKELHPIVFAISKWLEAEARKSLLAEYCDIHQIYNWINTEIFYPRDSRKILEKYSINNNKKIILGVSNRWSPDKGQLEMIQIANELPEAQIILVGHQNKNSVYPSNVITIEFTESQDELAELYSVADAFFNPSKQETFGLVSAEALACGTPVVVNNTTACPEFVTPTTGVVIDEQGILAAIQKVFAMELKYGRDYIQNRCREFALKNFNISTQIDKYLDVLRDTYCDSVK